MATPPRTKKRPPAGKSPAAAPPPAKKKAAPSSRLGASVDGKDLDDAAARALWIEFSGYMDENVGDIDGFARTKGWHAIVPEHRAGRAVLVIRTKP